MLVNIQSYALGAVLLKRFTPFTRVDFVRSLMFWPAILEFLDPS